MPDDRLALPFPDLAALDEHDLAHAVVEGTLSLVFPDPAARAAVGLRAISRGRHATMAWYLWTTRHRGAFEIVLLPSGDATRGSACLALRYFPEPREPMFALFAPPERAARSSTGFDATGTPHFAAADALDASLFHVATLTLHADEGGLALVLDAQDRWIEEACEAGTWTLRRDVPGLALGFAMLDALACALAYVGRQAPAGFSARRHPGARWRVDGDEAHAVEDPHLSDWRLAASGFASRSPEDSTAGIPATRVPRDDVDLLFPACRRWWEAPRWRFAPVGTFCAACEAEDDGHARGACRCEGHHHAS